MGNTESANTNNKEDENASAEEFFMRDVCERSRKITEALYRITDLFPEDEPLKWILRDKAMEIFNLTIFTKNDSFHQRVSYIEKISSEIYRIVQFLEVGQATSFISSLNFEVIKREYLTLKDCIYRKKDEALLQKKMPLLEECSKGHPDIVQDYIGHEDNNQMSDRKQTFDAVNNTAKINKEKIFQKNNIKNNILDNSNDLTDLRKNKIVGFIKSKKDLSVNIGELINIFSGVSGKTIQRDLKKLVNRGILKEQGEKRWRKYRLVTSH